MDTTNISSLFDLLNDRKIISVSGESGTGKTTLALQLISSALTRQDAFDDQAVWIQASEQFPKKRLLTFFRSSKSNGTPEALLRKIFLYPPSSPFFRYDVQSAFLRTLRSAILPFNTKYLVIDNISHHLRLAASRCFDIKQKMTLLNDFFDSQLFPLIMRCLNEKIVLILIHEVSFDPKLGKNQPFFNKLYSRINSLNVCLSKPFDFKSKTKRMELISKDKQIMSELKYEILERGISLV